MLETVFMAMGLAMDASCVSMTNAMSEKNMKWLKAIFFTLLFGVFQAVMPMIGYFVGGAFSKLLLNFIPLIVLVLLTALGLKSIIETVKDKKKGNEVKEKRVGMGEIFLQALATSIDALSVGVLFIEKSVGEAMLSFGIIGIITFAMSFICYLIGKKFCGWLKNKAAIVGGIVLILVGLKIFLPSVL